MSGFASACALLPTALRRAALALPENVRLQAQEFRLRLGRVPSVTLGRGETPLPGTAPVTHADLARLVEIAAGASPYAVAAAVQNGCLTAPGGVRLGLCGRMAPDTESAWIGRGLTSAAVRIPREVRGCAAPFCRDGFVSTLILSPPGAGKTTLLRDMVRLLSDRGERVSLCDERGEVAGLTSEGFTFDVGARTDVLTEAPKSRAALQLLRTMNPQILAMDELTEAPDAAACRAAAGCGVRLLATAHGDEDTCAPACRELLREGAFRRCVYIRLTADGRAYEERRL